MSARIASILALAAGLAAASAAPFEDLAVKGREIFNQYQKCVVTAQLVIKNKFSMGAGGNDSRELKQEISGTVIDPSGLTVLSLASTDPSGLLQNVLGELADEQMQMKMETEVSDVKLLGADGTEVPAEMVLRDRDLDLAFVRPKIRPETPMAFVNLSNASPAQVLDQVISINRLGKVAGRVHAASVERIQAVVPRPRLFYVPGNEGTATELGCPAFALDGKIVGLFVLRSARAGGSSSMVGRSITPILLPAAEVLKVARQVPPMKEAK